MKKSISHKQLDWINIEIWCWCVTMESWQTKTEKWCRKEDGRGLMSCKRKFTSEENNLAWYLKNFYKNLLQGVKHVGIQREISEIKIFEKFKILKKILKNRWMRKRYGKRNKCMNSLLEICNKTKAKKSADSRWKNVI